MCQKSKAPGGREMTLIIRKPSGRPIGKTRCEGGKKRSQRERKTRGCHVVKHRGKAGTEISDHRKQRRKEGGRDESRLTRISAPWLRVLGVTLMLRSQHCLSTPAVTLLRTE